MIGYGDGLNVYQYGYNDPNIYSDPLGLAADGSSLRSDTTLGFSSSGAFAAGYNLGFGVLPIGFPGAGGTLPGSGGAGNYGQPGQNAYPFFDTNFRPNIKLEFDTIRLDPLSPIQTSSSSWLYRYYVIPKSIPLSRWSITYTVYSYDRSGTRIGSQQYRNTLVFQASPDYTVKQGLSPEIPSNRHGIAYASFTVLHIGKFQVEINEVRRIRERINDVGRSHESLMRDLENNQNFPKTILNP